jgi:hypothetical protein
MGFLPKDEARQEALPPVAAVLGVNLVGITGYLWDVASIAL